MAIQDITLNPKIEKAAMEVFLEKGFLNASLAEICEKAGVTTGAIYTRYVGKEGLFSSLVEPTLEVLHRYIDRETQKSIENIEKKGIKFEFIRMEEKYLSFLDLLYDNYPGFKLLICKSHGSKYSNFLNDIIDEFSAQGYAFLKDLYQAGKINKIINENEYHIILTMTYIAMFKVIVHDFNKPDAIKYYKILNQFFDWESIFI